MASNGNTWVEGQSAWYNSIPLERRRDYEALCLKARKLFNQNWANTPAYLEAHEQACLAYEDLCFDFPPAKG